MPAASLRLVRLTAACWYGGLDIRQRTGWLFLAVIVGHIILISAQVNTRRGVPMLEAVTFGVFAEVQRAHDVGHRRRRRTPGRTTSRCSRCGARTSSCSRRSAQLRVRLQQERALAQQSRTLQQLLDLRSSLQVDTTGAAVIGGGASPEFRTMTIDKGTGDGLRPDMAVIAPAGCRRPGHHAEPRARPRCSC